jgi:hypothetical protein
VGCYETHIPTAPHGGASNRHQGRAAEIIHALLAALKLKDQVESEKVALTREHDIAELRLRLRAAHEKNWKRFSQSTQARSRLVADREEIVSNAMSRILLSEDSPSTPALMSPVTPLLGETPSSRSRQRVPYRTDLSSDIGDVYDLPQVIHTQGYVINSATQVEGSFCGPCSLCGGIETLLMLLFKKPPQDLHTPGFPGSGSRAKLTFPLAMGCFPETDVISTYLCCDPCSSHLARLGTSPLGDEIIGSYPLLRRGRDENQSTWIEALDEAFQKRFDRLDIELVFLAVLYNTREYCLSQSEHDLTLLIRALQWTFNDFMRNCVIDSTLGSPAPSPALPSTTVRFLEVIAPSCNQANLQLLRYPLEGFIVFLSSFKDIGRPCRAQLQTFVHEKFFFDMTAKYFDMREAKGAKACGEMLLGILSTTDGESTCLPDENLLRTPSTTLSLSDLSDNGLFTIEEIDSYRQLSHLSYWLEHKDRLAIWVYLYYLLDEAPRHETAADCYSAIHNHPNLETLFSAPGTVDNITALKLLQGCRSAQSWTWAGFHTVQSRLESFANGVPHISEQNRGQDGSLKDDENQAGPSNSNGHVSRGDFAS